MRVARRDHDVGVGDEVETAARAVPFTAAITGFHTCCATR